jgi:hypothetical protein
VNSRATRKFWAFYDALPTEVQLTAKRAYTIFRVNPHHPGLNFEKIQNSSIWSVRVGLHYRALGRMSDSNTIVWYWVGHHSVYDRLIGKV